MTLAPMPMLHELRGHTLKLVDKARQLRRPATLPATRPTAGRRAFAQGKEPFEFFVVPVVFHDVVSGFGPPAPLTLFGRGGQGVRFQSGPIRFFEYLSLNVQH